MPVVSRRSLPCWRVPIGSLVVGVVVSMALGSAAIAWSADPRSSDETPGSGVLQSVTLADIAAISDGFERDRAIYGLLASADWQFVERLLHEIGNLPANADSRGLARLAYQRFASLNSEAAAARVLEGNVEPSWVAAVFRSWAHRDLDAAVSRAASLPEPTRTAVARVLLELDLPAALLADVASRLEAMELLIEFETRRNRANIDAVFNRAAGDTDDPFREVRLRVAAEIWSVDDPTAALAASERLPAGALRDELRRLIVDTWSGVDPAAAVAWFSGSRQGQEETELIEASFAALVERDLPRALSHSETLPINPRMRARHALLRAALMENFDNALAFFDSLPEAEVALGELAMHVLAGYGNRPRKALEWAMSREVSGLVNKRYARGVRLDIREPNLWAWVRVFGERRPMLARTVIEEIADASSRDFAAAAYLTLGPRFGPTSWRGRDRRADVLWAESVASEAFLLRPEVANILVRVDPEQAAEVILRRDPGPARDEALRVALARSNVLAREHAERLLAAIESADARRRMARQLYVSRTGPGDRLGDGAEEDFRALCRYEFE